MYREVLRAMNVNRDATALEDGRAEGALEVRGSTGIGTGTKTIATTERHACGSRAGIRTSAGLQRAKRLQIGAGRRAERLRSQGCGGF